MSKNECMNLIQWTYHKIKSRLTKKPIEKKNLSTGAAPAQPQEADITTIAIVLDNTVQEVIKAETRLAALFLSAPDFVEVEPNKVRPTIGWSYIDGEFKEPVELVQENEVANEK